jgi:hypothetical protein
VLVRQVLRERIRAGDIPDFGLVRGRRPIFVRRELDEGVELTDDALPALRGVSLALIGAGEAAARAAQTGSAVFFVTLGGLTIRGDTATLLLGVDVAEPPGSGVKVCCCFRVVRYARTGSTWRFAGWGEGLCS